MLHFHTKSQYQNQTLRFKLKASLVQFLKSLRFENETKNGFTKLKVEYEEN